MSNRKVKKLSVMVASVAATSVLGFSGIASAASIYNTGPGSNNVISSSYNGWQGGNWNNWDPIIWQQNGQSFNNWWIYMMSQARHYNASNWHQGTNHWNPGNNWQNKWSNWNPAYWMSHGQNYNNWYTHFNNQSNYWKNNWNSHNNHHQNNGYWNRPNNRSYNSSNNNSVNVSNSNQQNAATGAAHVSGNTFGGNASTGNASNSNSTHANVSVANTATAHGNGYLGNSNGGASINNTGPFSNNGIHSWSNNSYKSTNNNNVSVTNSNAQTAHSGKASVKGNTFGGSAVTGSATNTNQNRTDVSVKNN